LESNSVFVIDQGICFIIGLTNIIYDFEIIIYKYFGLIYLPRNQFFLYYKTFKGFIINIDSNFPISYLKLRVLFIQGPDYN
jgi:hypothetical protein